MPTDRQRLLRAARRLLASYADAEDAVQDTYLRALTAFPDHSGPEPAWLYTVLRHVAIDRLRRKRLESEHNGGERLGGGPSAEGWSAEGSSTSSTDGSRIERPTETLPDIRSECEAALRHLLSRVSPAEAAAILLRDVFEFDYDEIGRIAGKNAAASRQFLHRARIRVRGAAPTSDREDPYVAWCWRAIETRDPALLMHLLQVTTARSQPVAAIAGRSRGARTSSVLVQVNGRYAIALVLDGVVLCTVPVGTQAAIDV